MKIVITVGLPGSGKSTYLAGLGVNPISSDNIRRLLIDDPYDQSIHGRVFAAMRYLLRHRLAIGRPASYVDATHLMRWERRPYVKMAQRYGCTIEAWFFDVPAETCIERNRQRDPMVPAEAIRIMAESLQPPTREEGFTRVRRITSL
ncbi:MAG TPA: ATP-binding protein [Bryobacteraceae bacterium]|nr:ATP-binding protein [Bryobacteraceae bacterium]